MDRNEDQLLAWVQWEVAAERLTLELALPTGDEWDERPLHIQTALRLAEAALEAVRRAFGLQEPERADAVETPAGL